MTNESPISEREREILRLVATGATNQQIAIALNISVNTVKVHLRNIFAKIGVESRTEATVYAIRTGIVTVGEAGLASTDEAVSALEPVPFGPPQPVDHNQTPVPLSEPVSEVPVIAPATIPEPAPPASLPPQAPAPNPSIAGQDVQDTVTAPTPPARPIIRFFSWLIGLTAVLVIIITLFVATARPTSNPSLTTNPTATSRLNPEQRWFTRQPLNDPRDNFALTGYDLERRLYVIGGQRDGSTVATVDRYDPETNRWVTLTDKPTAVSHARAITLRGLIFVPGGEDSTGAVIDRLEIYDPREQRWYTGAALPAPRSRYTLAAWEGQLYLIGGWDGTSIRNEVFIYDPIIDRWETGPALPQPRRNAGTAIAGGRLYIIGGEGVNGPLRESARLEPSTDPNRRWIAIAPLPQPIARPATIALSSTLLVFDGERREGLTYDIAADAWSRTPLPPEAHVFPDAVLLDASIYFVGNRQAQGMLSEYRALYVIFIPGQ
ncbi:LuxR family transcriptional regulator [Chloroflexus islandicus]|uniref:LuxR family transcriptional regulator n=1 Tax=Chloroflexus islandicus TaxID=1707952 RepID=A0A178M6F0_9CHLR|nr:LuxR C-terminal-related transcriptional regulator [Chloroflexus islandicus]OAN44322.1 LuxR family transcriptional regulator [Chloroflexus islandicus]